MLEWQSSHSTSLRPARLQGSIVHIALVDIWLMTSAIHCQNRTSKRSAASTGWERLCVGNVDGERSFDARGPAHHYMANANAVILINPCTSGNHSYYLHVCMIKKGKLRICSSA